VFGINDLGEFFMSIRLASSHLAVLLDNVLPASRPLTDPSRPQASSQVGFLRRFAMSLGNLKSSRMLAAFVSAAVVLTFTMASPAQAQTPTTIYSFPVSPGPKNPNIEAIAQGRDGNLYLTAAGGDGGALDCTVTYCGEAFKITTAGAVTDVFDFSNNNCGVDNCGNGAYGGLTLGVDGNFYGAFFYGGTTGNNGEVFKLTPTGALTALHNFTGAGDGARPYGSPIQAASGIFYGTTTSATVADSTAYSVTSAGVFTTLHTFTGADGQNVYAPLVQGTDGNFYGDTVSGGASNNGVVFRMTPAGAVTVLHNFSGTDGSNAYYPLIQANDGNFYGTTYSGGTFGAGVIFKITSGGVYTVLHNINGTTDGTGPAYALVQATNGKLYGITSDVEIGLNGTIFSITTTGAFTTLYSFTGGADGGDPLSPLRQHTDGLLYGTTDIGGDPNTGCLSVVNINGQAVEVGGCGTVYSLNIAAKPFVSLVTASGKVGSKIGILGQGFSASSVVKFNGVTATTVARTGTTFLLATVPAGANDGYVTVTTGTTTLTSSQKFTVHNSWGSGAALPTAVQWPMTATIGNLIYVVGGYTTSAAVADNQIYNPATNKWTTGTALPAATAQGATAVVNNILYIFGGSDNGGGTVSNAVYAYNPTTKAWASKTAMPTARCSVTAVVEKGIVYVIGGYNGNRLNTVEAYNPATDTWAAEAPMLTGRSEISTGLIGTTIVASGGFTSGGVTGDTEGYNATTNTWSALTADSVHRNGACAGAIGANLYAVNGNDNSNNAFSVNEAFNLAANKWTTLAASPQSMTDAGPAVYGGQLYCFGGASFANAFRGTVYNNVQIYQP
jgi:uncharacterized repeat protein (TIGR03803 family)